jgi:hypothetical protein
LTYKRLVYWHFLEPFQGTSKVDKWPTFCCFRFPKLRKALNNSELEELDEVASGQREATAKSHSKSRWLLVPFYGD